MAKNCMHVTDVTIFFDPASSTSSFFCLSFAVALAFKFHKPDLSLWSSDVQYSQPMALVESAMSTRMAFQRRKPGKSNVSLVEKHVKLQTLFYGLRAIKTNCSFMGCEISSVNIFNLFLMRFCKVFVSVRSMTLLAEVVHLIQVSIPFGGLIRVQAPGAALIAAEYVDWVHHANMLKHGIDIFGRV